MSPTVKTRWSSPSICIDRSFAASSAIVVVSPFIRTIRTGAIYGSYAALHAIHSYSPECVKGRFSEVYPYEDEHEVPVVGRGITLRPVLRALRVPRDAGVATRQALRAGRPRSQRRSGA